MDSLAIESNIYSPATLRQVYGGKAFKIGVEHHIMNFLAGYYLQFDAVIEKSSSDSVKNVSIYEMDCTTAMMKLKVFLEKLRILTLRIFAMS